MRPFSIPVAILLTGLGLGCSTSTEPADAIDECFSCAGKADANTPDEGSCAADGVLAFASSATLATLDYDVGLDVRAARGISEHGTFSTLAELDAIPYVSPGAFARLIDFADSLGLLECGKSIPSCAVTLRERSTNARVSMARPSTSASPEPTTMSSSKRAVPPDDLLFFCSQLDLIELTEGDPNTEFSETFSRCRKKRPTNAFPSERPTPTQPTSSREACTQLPRALSAKAVGPPQVPLSSRHRFRDPAI